jgi:predicted membrane protein
MKIEEKYMLYILLGIFIGIIISLSGIISVKTIIRKNEIKKLKEYDILEPLIFLLIDNDIINNGTKYLEDIKNKCVYVFTENELKQYTYKNNKENDFFEINSINIPENIANILGDYIMWNVGFGLNSVYGKFYRFNHQIKYKRKNYNK